jgi:hypothetical protein
VDPVLNGRVLILAAGGRSGLGSDNGMSIHDRDSRMEKLLAEVVDLAVIGYPDEATAEKASEVVSSAHPAPAYRKEIP